VADTRCGTFDGIDINTKTHAVRAGSPRPLPPLHAHACAWNSRPEWPAPARIIPEKTAEGADAFVVTLQNKTAWIELVDNQP